MKWSDIITEHFKKSMSTKQQTIEVLSKDIEMSASIMVEALEAGHKILLCGNGGSAADSQHIAAELVIRLRSSFSRPAIPAIALTVDSSILTAGGNDFGFNEVFARQVEALGQKGDVLIGISTSGNSMNVVRAVETASSLGLQTIGLLGGDGGRLAELVSHRLIIPSQETAHIQETHITIGHIWCRLLEERLYGI